MLEGAALPSSRGSSPRLLHCRCILYPLIHLGSTLSHLHLDKNLKKQVKQLSKKKKKKKERKKRRRRGEENWREISCHTLSKVLIHLAEVDLKMWFWMNVLLSLERNWNLIINIPLEVLEGQYMRVHVMCFECSFIWGLFLNSSVEEVINSILGIVWQRLSCLLTVSVLLDI